MVNLVAGLIAYTYQPKKPSLGLRVRREAGLPVCVEWSLSRIQVKYTKDA